MSLSVCWPTLKVELIKGYVVVKTGMTLVRGEKKRGNKIKVGKKNTCIKSRHLNNMTASSIHKIKWVQLNCR